MKEDDVQTIPVSVLGTVQGAPDFSNEKADFWIDHSSTDYLRTGSMGTKIAKLKNWTVLNARIRETGEEVWVLHDGKELVEEMKNLSELTTTIDMTKARAIYGMKP